MGARKTNLTTERVNYSPFGESVYGGSDQTFEEIKEENLILKADNEGLKMKLQGHVSDAVTLNGKFISVKGQLAKKTIWDNIWGGLWGFLTAITTELIIHIFKN